MFFDCDDTKNIDFVCLEILTEHPSDYVRPYNS